MLLLLLIIILVIALGGGIFISKFLFLLLLLLLLLFSLRGRFLARLEPPIGTAHASGPGWTRTTDQRIMSPLL